MDEEWALATGQPRPEHLVIPFWRLKPPTALFQVVGQIREHPMADGYVVLHGHSPSTGYSQGTPPGPKQVKNFLIPSWVMQSVASS